MIHNTDCLSYLSTIASDSIDYVLVDPPYFIGFDGGKGWDRQWSTEQEYLNWCKEWTQECVRVLKPNRMLTVWGTLKTDTFLRYKLEILNNLPIVPQNEIIWSYNWGGRSKSNFARKHEYAWNYSKGDSFLFNADDVRVERRVSKNLRTGESHTQGTIPTCVWERNNHTTSKEFCGWHPTTKNIELLSRLIKAYTNPGDTVLDSFMGSGSTAIAAAQTGRLYTGSELDSDYYRQSITRIANLSTNV
jgi:DNA modification methylase